MNAREQLKASISRYEKVLFWHIEKSNFHGVSTTRKKDEDKDIFNISFQ